MSERVKFIAAMLEGDESFLAPATERTTKLWDRLNELFLEERKKGVPWTEEEHK